MRAIVLFIFMMLLTTSEAQQIFVEVGKSSSGFDYENSQGQSIDNLLSKSNTYITAGYRDVLNNAQTLFLTAGLTYNGYGAIGSDPVLDNFFEWDVTYLGLQLGIEYKLISIRDFSIFLRAAPSAEFLIEGNQILNNQVFNLVGEEEFNSSIFFLRAGIKMTYPVSRTALLTAGYAYGKTALIDQGNQDDQEKLKLNSHQFGIGIVISLPSCNCPY